MPLIKAAARRPKIAESINKQDKATASTTDWQHQPLLLPLTLSFVRSLLGRPAGRSEQKRRENNMENYVISLAAAATPATLFASIGRAGRKTASTIVVADVVQALH